MSLAEKGIFIRKTLECDLRSIYLAVSEISGLDSDVLSADHLAELFASENSVMYSAVRKKQLLGFITGNIKRDEAAVETIYVKDKFRSIGIGSTLLEKFLTSSKKTGSLNYLISVHEENQKALNFFLSRGFVQSGSTIILKKNL